MKKTQPRSFGPQCSQGQNVATSQESPFLRERRSECGRYWQCGSQRRMPRGGGGVWRVSIRMPGGIAWANTAYSWGSNLLLARTCHLFEMQPGCSKRETWRSGESRVCGSVAHGSQWDSPAGLWSHSWVWGPAQLIQKNADSWQMTVADARTLIWICQPPGSPPRMPSRVTWGKDP